MGFRRQQTGSRRIRFVTLNEAKGLFRSFAALSDDDTALSTTDNLLPCALEGHLSSFPELHGTIEACARKAPAVRREGNGPYGVAMPLECAN